MNVLSLSAREWRDQLQTILDRAIEEQIVLIYMRRDVPAFFVIPRPMTSLIEQHEQWERLRRIHAMATGKPEPEPLSLETPIPSLPSNGLRRDLNETLIRLKREGIPLLLRRYDDVIGFVVPVAQGGGLGLVKAICKRYQAELVEV